MKEKHDLSNAERATRTRSVKRQITINIDVDTVDYFKRLAKKTGVPYQRLINLYLTDCAKCGKELKMIWDKGSE